MRRLTQLDESLADREGHDLAWSSDRLKGSALPASFSRVLIAVDTGPRSAHTALVGSAMALALDATLGFLHVVDPAAVFIGETGIPVAQLVADAEREAAGFLERLRLSTGFTRAARTFVLVGRPAEAIARAAAEWRADLLVVGLHGRSAITDALLGSVAQAVVHRSPCPVLVVRPAAQHAP